MRFLTIHPVGPAVSESQSQHFQVDSQAVPHSAIAVRNTTSSCLECRNAFLCRLGPSLEGSADVDLHREGAHCNPTGSYDGRRSTVRRALLEVI